MQLWTSSVVRFGGVYLFTFDEWPLLGVFSNLQCIAIIVRPNRKQITHTLIVDLHVAAKTQQLPLSYDRVMRFCYIRIIMQCISMGRTRMLHVLGLEVATF